MKSMILKATKIVRWDYIFSDIYFWIRREAIESEHKQLELQHPIRLAEYKAKYAHEVPSYKIEVESE